MTRTIVLPLPPKELSPNARVHYMAKAKAAKRYRNRAALEAAAVRPDKPWKRATVQAFVYHKIRRGRDGDNMLASLKSAIDGLADGGIIENDRELTHKPVVFGVDKSNPRVELLITRDEP